MGTYTVNYNLFMPSIGEQGWGELVNGNFTTIDNTIKSLSNNIGTLDAEIDAVEERVTTLEAGNFETINVAGTIEAEEFVGGVGNFSSLMCKATTTNTGIVLGSATFEKTYSVRQQYNQNVTYTIIPTFTFIPEVNKKIQFLRYDDIDGLYTCSVSIKNNTGDLEGNYNIVINGVSTRLFTISGFDARSATFQCRNGDSVSFTISQTRINYITTTYSGTLALNANIYLL